MRDHKVSGEDPISVFDLFTRIVEEADTLAMSEGQLIVCLPHLLTKNAAQNYRYSSNNSGSGNTLRWPEAVQYLLRTYATEQAIREAVEQFENLRQASNEDEHAFASRVGVAAYRCGNVHTDIEKITVFVNGLLPAIRSVVSRFRREQPRYSLTFDRIVSYARDEGDSYRARLPSRSSTPGPPSRPVRFANPPSQSLTGRRTNLYLLGDADDEGEDKTAPGTPIPPSDLPVPDDNSSDTETQQLLAFHNRDNHQRHRDSHLHPRSRSASSGRRSPLGNH